MCASKDIEVLAGDPLRGSEGSAPGWEQFTTADLEQLVQTTFIEQLEFHAELSSTNDRALEIARGQPEGGPLLIVAERQTAGRGRGSNRWWASPGALTFSLLWEPAAVQLPACEWPRVSLIAGLAIGEALEEFAGTCAPVQLKWPNDVFLAQRKVCGILVELPRSADHRTLMVLGVGINVNNSVTEASAELQGTATALCDITGRQFRLAEVLQRVLHHLAQRLEGVVCKDDSLLTAWRARCLLTDRDIEVDLGNRRISGACQGIDEEGALVVKTREGLERCLAGVVTTF